MQPAVSWLHPEQRPPSHALEAYVAHLNIIDDGNRHRRLKHARRFIRLYPDLTEWQRASLVERLGSTIRRGPAYACAAARPYLYFLVQQGLLVLDWPWIIGAQCHVLPIPTLPPPIQAFSASLCERLRALGYRSSGVWKVERAIRYFFIRHGVAVVDVDEADLAEFSQALSDFPKRDDAITIYGSPEHLRRTLAGIKTMLFTFRAALYHKHRINRPPKREVAPPKRLQVKPAMQQFIERYAQARLALHTSPGTVGKLRNAGNHFADWLVTNYPTVESFAEATREQVLAYSASLVAAGVNVETQITRLSSLSVMFHDATAWGWPEAPNRPLIGARDLPKRPNRVPRFIPAEELDRLMAAIRTLECPYQRAALIIARWAGPGAEKSVGLNSTVWTVIWMGRHGCGCRQEKRPRNGWCRCIPMPPRPLKSFNGSPVRRAVSRTSPWAERRPGYSCMGAPSLHPLSVRSFSSDGV